MYNHNIPDRWVIIELKTPDEVHHKVMASWYGGYDGSDSWKISSGIVDCVMTENGYAFHNQSGSVYNCRLSSYGMSSYAASVYSSFEKQNTDDMKIRLLTEDEVIAKYGTPK